MNAAAARPFDVALLNSAATNDEILQSAKAHVQAGGTLNATDAKGLSLIEICWKNEKPKTEFNRRNLLASFAALGLDAAAQLPDGTTALNRGMVYGTRSVNGNRTVSPIAGSTGCAGGI